MSSQLQMQQIKIQLEGKGSGRDSLRQRNNTSNRSSVRHTSTQRGGGSALRNFMGQVRASKPELASASLINPIQIQRDRNFKE